MGNYSREPEKPLKLQTVIFELEAADVEKRTYYNTDTGYLYYVDGAFPSSEWDDPEPDFEDDAWVVLPGWFDLDDLTWMRHFARWEPSPVGEELMDAAYARHPYREFRHAAARLGCLQRWFAYRDDRLREVALEWFADHDMTPPDNPPSSDAEM